MPRLNVEEEFWSDQRVEVLKEKIGRFQAWGVCLGMWKLAQKYWNGDCKPIPKIMWDLSGFPKEVFEVGLAVEKNDGVYVCGSQKHFDWYKKKCSAAKIGGKARAALVKASESADGKPNASEWVPEAVPSSSSSSSTNSVNSVSRAKAPNKTVKSVKEKKAGELRTELEAGEVDSFIAVLKENIPGWEVSGGERGQLFGLLKTFASMDLATNWIEELWPRIQKQPDDNRKKYLLACVASELKKAREGDVWNEI